MPAGTTSTSSSEVSAADERVVTDLGATPLSAPLVWLADGSRLLGVRFGMTDGELWMFDLETGASERLMTGIGTVIGWR